MLRIQSITGQQSRFICNFRSLEKRDLSTLSSFCECASPSIQLNGQSNDAKRTTLSLRTYVRTFKKIKSKSERPFTMVVAYDTEICLTASDSV